MIPDFVARDPKVTDQCKLELMCDLEWVNPSQAVSKYVHNPVPSMAGGVSELKNTSVSFK
jgi:hypothetical protein